MVDVGPSLVADNVCSNNTVGHGMWVGYCQNLTIASNVCSGNGDSEISWLPNG